MTTETLAPPRSVSHSTELPAMLRDPFRAQIPRSRNMRGPRMRKLLLLSDIFAVCLAILVVEAARRAGWDSSTSTELLVASVVAGVPAWLVCAQSYGLYHLDTHRVEHGIAEEAGRIIKVATLWAWGIVVVFALTKGNVAWIEQLVVLWAGAALLVMAARVVARAYARRQLWYLQNALVLGASPQARSVVRKILRHPELRVNVVGVVDLDGTGSDHGFGHVPLIRDRQDITELIDTLDVDRVIIGWGAQPVDRDGLLHELAATGVHIDLIPTWFDALGARVDVHEFEGSPLMTLPRGELGRGSQFIKRLFDVSLSLAGIVALMPLFVVCAIALKLDSRGPVFFRQVRVGRDGKRFNLLKLRSMRVDAEERKAEVVELNFHPDGAMFKIREDPRVTRVGRVLRRYSLDELPQLVNVLRGEMSLVGPRPLIESEAERVLGRFGERRSLTPGLTGLWQVNGRSEIPFDEMVSLDYLYVTNWSLWGDVKLMIKTLPAVAGAQGAY